MKQRFDLFKLHDSEEDGDPRWSWIRGSGKELNKYIRGLMKEITAIHGTNVVVKEINKQLPELSEATISDYFWSPKMENFPLVFLDVLSKQFENSEEIKWGIQDKIELLSISRWDSKPIRAVKEPSLTLCKVAGAHAADGALWGEYNLELVDADKNAVGEYCKWLEIVFGYKKKCKKHKTGEAYHVYFKSKIIGRYLNKFLDFPIGKKSAIVSEPQLIKESTLRFRRAFALGVMTFDGSVTMWGEAMLNVKSKSLVYGLADICGKDDIRFNIKRDTRGKFTLQFRICDSKLLLYFDKQSKKHQRLYELINGHRGRADNIADAKKAFDLAYPRRSNSSTSFSEIIELTEKIGHFCCRDISHILSWLDAPMTRGSIMRYMRVLQRNGVIACIKRVGKNHERIFEFNKNIIDWKIPIRT